MWKSVIAIGALVSFAACSEQAGSESAAAQTEPEAPAPVAAQQPEPEPAPEVAAAASGPVDGELQFPAEYKSWSVFLSNIQKADTQQIREIYLNPAAEAASGAPLPNGSVLVMEIYTVETDDAGAAVTDADGNLQKKELSKVFVMEKGEGWGAGVPDGLANGNWVYAAYEADGSKAEVEYNACRACHAPLTDQDYVHRYTEYLEQR